MKLTREHVLTEIQRLAHENGGKAPGQKLFASHTGIQEHDWRRYWPRWTLALQEAGFEANPGNQPLDKEAVLSRLAAEVLRLGHMPTGREREVIHREVHTRNTTTSVPPARTGRKGRKPASAFVQVEVTYTLGP